MPEATILIIFATSFLVALSGALMPGPLLAITVSEAAKHGFWVGPLVILGHAILELALVVALVLGISEIVERDLLSAVVGLVGGIVLLGMGVIVVRSGWQRRVMETGPSKNVMRSRSLVLSGILGSISNPYWLIWWLTMGMTYLLWSMTLGIAGVASFFTGHILADLAWYALVAFIIATGKKVINDTVYQWLLVMCGLTLLALGGYFMAAAIEFFVH